MERLPSPHTAMAERVYHGTLWSGGPDSVAMVTTVTVPSDFQYRDIGAGKGYENPKKPPGDIEHPNG